MVRDSGGFRLRVDSGRGVVEEMIREAPWLHPGLVRGLGLGRGGRAEGRGGVGGVGLSLRLPVLCGGGSGPTAVVLQRAHPPRVLQTVSTGRQSVRQVHTECVSQGDTECVSQGDTECVSQCSRSIQSESVWVIQSVSVKAI